jgi:hypothetical protein
MPALVAGIHVLLDVSEDVDGTANRTRPICVSTLPEVGKPTSGDKPGHDGSQRPDLELLSALRMIVEPQYRYVSGLNGPSVGTPI